MYSYAVSADIISGMYNTGENFTYGDFDTNYMINDQPAVIHQQGYPVGSAWPANSVESMWISTTANSSTVWPGIYNFVYSYNLDVSLDPDTATISGLIAADNAYAIIHNGNQIYDYTVNNFNFDTFTIDDYFQTGNNEIIFQVHNLGNSSNPMALRVEYTNANASLIPEPTTLSGIILCSIGIVSLRRRFYIK